MGKFTAENAKLMGSRGGKATASTKGSVHMATIGKRGFNTTVARHWNGNRAAYTKWLRKRALMALDPFPQNGAWTPPPPSVAELARTALRNFPQAQPPTFGVTRDRYGNKEFLFVNGWKIIEVSRDEVIVKHVVFDRSGDVGMLNSYDYRLTQAGLIIERMEQANSLRVRRREEANQ